MNLNYLHRLSLKARVTLTTLVIFLVGVWTLALLASHTLRGDMEHLLGEQQFLTASYMAADVNQELGYRMEALESVAPAIAPALLQGGAALQKNLEQRTHLHSLFNGGVIVLRLDGTAIADFPRSTGRVGVNYMGVDNIAIALTQGKSVIGLPVMDAKLHAPAFGMTVPLRDAQGRVIGALSGSTDLGKPNFLDGILSVRNGKNAGYSLLVAPQQRLIITSSDRTRVMEPILAPGRIPQVDRFNQGYEGSSIYVNSLGVEVLASGRAIPMTGWYMMLTLPTAVAYAPIRALQQRELIYLFIFTLLAAVLIWWTLKRQLAPLQDAARALAALDVNDHALRPLPIAGPDEVGQLISAFNQLLKRLEQKREVLRESDFRWQFAIEGAGIGVWDWNLQTGVTQYSRLWKEMLGYGEAEAMSGDQEWVHLIYPEDLAYVLGSNQDYLDGKKEHHSVEYRLRCKDGSYKWVHSRGIVVSHSEDGKPLRMIGTHADITQRRLAELALQKSYDELHSILDTTLDGFWSLDAQGRFVDVNPAYCQQSGYSREELLTMHVSDVEAAGSAADTAAHIRIIIQTGREQFESSHTRKDGSIWQVEVSATGRNVTGPQIFVFLRDISERKQSEAALRVAAVAFESQEAMVITDPDGVIVRVNRAFTRITGYTEKELLGQTPRLLRSGRHGRDFYREMWKTIRHTGAWQGEIWDRRKGGEVYPKWLSISEVRDDAGALVNYIGSHQEISERKNAEAALRQMNAALDASKNKLRALAAKNEARLEEERKHIAREVHDELGQVLTALRMNISLAGMRHAAQDPALLDELGSMKELVDRAIQGVRNVAVNLRPAALDMGLVPAIEWLCSEFTQRSGIACAVHAPEEGIDLDEARAVVIFRIVQESLTNIARYAQASQVAVNLGRRGNELGVEVRDNGQGFDVADASRRTSFGLLGMRERALTLGGHVDVISAPGQGTVIGVSIPLDRVATQEIS